MNDYAGALAASPESVERERLAVLESLEILDTPPDRAFDTIVQAAQQLLGCKIALVSLVDDTRQWFKAKCGLSVDQTPRELAFCAHAVRADDVLIVPDAKLDERFCDNPLVTGAPFIRFYAGVPIRACDPTGDAVHYPMGTLCVIDDAPREPDADQIRTLGELAHLVEALLSARTSAMTALTLAADRGNAITRLDRTHRQFRQAERMANIGSWRLTLADNHAEWSEQVYVIHGVPYGTDHYLGDALDFYPPQARALIEAAVRRTIATGQPFDLETDLITAQGEYRRVRSMGELELADGEPVALIGVFQDITARYAMEQALRQTAETDDLTRIATRRRFNKLADEQIAEFKASGDPLAVLLIDLDHFKDVNDRCGHLAGDDLLRLMATRLQAPYLADSLPARLGGDEFVLLINSRGLLADLPSLLQRLLSDLRQTVRAGGVKIDVTATIGACMLDERMEERSDLLHQADTALYEAKRKQRGSAKIFGGTGLILPGQTTLSPLHMLS